MNTHTRHGSVSLASLLLLTLTALCLTVGCRADTSLAKGTPSDLDADIEACEEALREIGSTRPVLHSRYQDRIDAWRSAAAAGDPRGQYLMGRLYGTGLGVPVDKLEAHRHYAAAHEQGLAIAAISLAVSEMSGRPEVAPNLSASQLLEGPASENYVPAMRLLGYWALHGKAPERDAAWGVQMLQSAQQKGSVRAGMDLGLAYVQGIGVRADAERGRALLEEAARNGCPPAYGELGRLAASTHPSTRESTADSEKWWERGAERGDAGSAWSLFRLADSAGDLQSAEVWLARARELGHPGAALLLGDIYTGGHAGRDRDLATAVAHYQFAAYQGDADAALRLGFLHDPPREDRAILAGLAGIPHTQAFQVVDNPKPEDAQRWYAVAASQGSMLAIGCLLDAEASSGVRYEEPARLRQILRHAEATRGQLLARHESLWPRRWRREERLRHHANGDLASWSTVDVPDEAVTMELGSLRGRIQLLDKGVRDFASRLPSDDKVGVSVLKQLQEQPRSFVAELNRRQGAPF